MIFTEEEGKKIFFTSDSHFHHENIIKYCRRPFKNIEEHDAELIRRWNEKVPEDGIVFHLGDVGFGNPQTINEILNQLNGTIYLVIGNHDWRSIVKNHSWRFREMTQQINMKIGKQHIILNHYPLLCFSGAWRGIDATWQLFGHVHSNKEHPGTSPDITRLGYLMPTQYDVGVDNNNYTPVSFADLKIIMQKQIEKSK